MKQITEDTVRALLKSLIEHDGWDQPPFIFMFDSEGKGAFVPVPEVPEEFQEERDAIDMISALASGVRDNVEGIASSLPPGIAAVGLITEGHSLKAEAADLYDGSLEKAVEAIREMGLRFEDHPLAIEVKMVNVIDAEGSASYCLERGSDSFTMMSGLGAGRVPNALTALFEAITGAQK